MPKIVLVKTSANQAATVEDYELRSSKGKVSIVSYRLENGAELLDYIWAHLPDRSKAI